MLLHKTLSLTDVQLKVAVTDDPIHRFSGYASKWNGVDSYGDTILPGAFYDTLAKRKPKMFFNHRWDTMPIGKWTELREDPVGLFVSGELTPDLAEAEDVFAALKHGTIDGLSIGGYLAAEDCTETDTGRVIHRWSNLVEISPVVFPADDAARVNLASVKTIDFETALPECRTERDIERLLRDAGLGKWEAMAIVSRARAILAGRDAPPASSDLDPHLLERLQRLAA